MLAYLTFFKLILMLKILNWNIICREIITELIFAGYCIMVLKIENNTIVLGIWIFIVNLCLHSLHIN